MLVAVGRLVGITLFVKEMSTPNVCTFQWVLDGEMSIIHIKYNAAKADCALQV